MNLKEIHKWGKVGNHGSRAMWATIRTLSFSLSEEYDILSLSRIET